VALLLLPSPTSATQPEDSIPLLTLPHDFDPTPDPFAWLKKCIGRTLDRIIGFIWLALVIIGAGHAVVGICNFILGLVPGHGGSRNQVMVP